MYHQTLHANSVYRALGCKGQIIPKAMQGTFNVVIVPREGCWSDLAYTGPLVVKAATGAYAKHRIFVPCPCGRLVPFGRISQHKCK